jgi:hypothetical protein
LIQKGRERKAKTNNNHDTTPITEIDIVDSGFKHSQIAWEDTQEPPVLQRMEYADRYGEYSERMVAVRHFKGSHQNGHEYLGAYDDGTFKSFRKDRILKLEKI